MSSATKNFVIDFTEWDILIIRIFLYFSGLFNIITSLITIYIIVYKSDKCLGKYKLFLLNLFITSTLFFLFLSVILAPISTLPILGFCTTGPINFIENQLCIIFITIVRKRYLKNVLANPF